MIKALFLFVNICINIFDYLPQLSHTYIIWQIEPSSQHQDTKRSHRNCFNDQKKLGLPVLVTLWLMKSPLKKLKFPLMELPAKQETTTNDTQILRPVLYLWNRQNQAKANKHENNLHVEAQDFIAVWKFSPPLQLITKRVFLFKTFSTISGDWLINFIVLMWKWLLKFGAYDGWVNLWDNPTEWEYFTVSGSVFADKSMP